MTDGTIVTRTVITEEHRIHGPTSAAEVAKASSAMNQMITSAFDDSIAVRADGEYIVVSRVVCDHVAGESLFAEIKRLVSHIDDDVLEVMDTMRVTDEKRTRLLEARTKLSQIAQLVQRVSP